MVQKFPPPHQSATASFAMVVHTKSVSELNKIIAQYGKAYDNIKDDPLACQPTVTYFKEVTEIALTELLMRENRGTT